MTPFTEPSRVQPILDTLQEVVFQTDAEGAFTFLTHAWERLTGFPVAETLGRNSFDYLEAGDRERHRALFRSIVEGRTLDDRHEVQLLTAGGDVRVVELRGRLLRDDDGVPTSVVGTLTDVTQRKSAERQLVLQHAVARVLTDSDGVEQAAPSLLEAIGKGMGWDLGEFWVAEARADRLRLVAFWRGERDAGHEFEAIARRTTFARGVGVPGMAWKRGVPVWMEDVTREADALPREQIAAAEGLHGAVGLPIVAPDGEVIAVACFFARRVWRPEPSLEDSLAALAGQIAQFAQRRRAETALRRQLNRSASVVESSGDAIVTVAADRTITSWNRGAERIFACPRERILGHCIDELFPASHAGEVDRLIAEVRRGGIAVAADVPGRRSDGRHIDLAVTASPVLDEHETVSDVSLILRDVTRRRRIEEELRRSNAELEQFAAALSHDLIEPLRTISGFAELVARRYAERLDERGVEMLEHLRDGALRMDRMVHGLRDFASAGRDLAVEAVSLHDVAQRTIAALAARLEATGAEVVVGQLPVVLADRAAVERIVQNLLHNALKFTRPGVAPRVEITGHGEEGWVRLSVADNGVGIAPEHHATIFAMFRRGPHASSHEGTGLGLSMCQKLAERHGGRVWVESDPGAGSTFHVVLPAAAGPLEAASKASTLDGR